LINYDINIDIKFISKKMLNIHGSVQFQVNDFIGFFDSLASDWQ